MDCTFKKWIYHTVASDGEISFYSRKLATVGMWLNASDCIFLIVPPPLIDDRRLILEILKLL